ncbi:hypothetical protein D3C84_418280 [compost metagenome]
MIFAVVQVVCQVARHVGEQHVVGDVSRHHYANAGHQAAPVLGGHLLERHFRASGKALAITLFQLLDMLLERRCLLQRVTQVESDHAQGQGEEEGQAPTPCLKLLFTENGGNQHDQTCAEDEAGDRAEIQPAA